MAKGAEGASGVKVRRFEARLVRLERYLGWTVVWVPFVPREVWGEMIRLRVRGRVNGFEFRSSLFAAGERVEAEGSGFFLLVTRAMQRGAGVGAGESARFELAADLEARPAELPEELEEMLDGEPGLREWYESLSESMRREIGKWVGGATSEAARSRRCAQMAERLLGAMEGEREMPPQMAAAFRRRPKAKAGWERMTERQRRQELLAYYYYQSPEARARRLEKTCELAERRAE